MANTDNTATNKPKAIQVGSAGQAAIATPSNDVSSVSAVTSAPKAVSAAPAAKSESVKVAANTSAAPKAAAQPVSAAKKPAAKKATSSKKPAAKKAAPKTAQKPVTTTAKSSAQPKSSAKKPASTANAARDWVFAFTDQWQYGSDYLTNWIEDAFPAANLDFAKKPYSAVLESVPTGKALDQAKDFALAQVNVQQYTSEKAGDFFGKLHDVSNSFYGESMDVAKLWLQVRTTEDVAELNKRQYAYATEAFSAAFKAWNEFSNDVAKDAAEPVKQWAQNAGSSWFDWAKKSFSA